MLTYLHVDMCVRADRTKVVILRILHEAPTSDLLNDGPLLLLLEYVAAWLVRVIQVGGVVKARVWLVVQDAVRGLLLVNVVGQVVHRLLVGAGGPEQGSLVALVDFKHRWGMLMLVTLRRGEQCRLVSHFIVERVHVFVVEVVVHTEPPPTHTGLRAKSLYRLCGACVLGWWVDVASE